MQPARWFLRKKRLVGILRPSWHSWMDFGYVFRLFVCPVHFEKTKVRWHVFKVLLFVTLHLFKRIWCSLSFNSRIRRWRRLSIWFQSVDSNNQLLWIVFEWGLDQESFSNRGSEFLEDGRSYVCRSRVLMCFIHDCSTPGEYHGSVSVLNIAKTMAWSYSPRAWLFLTLSNQNQWNLLADFRARDIWSIFAKFLGRGMQRHAEASFPWNRLPILQISLLLEWVLHWRVYCLLKIRASLLRHRCSQPPRLHDSTHDPENCRQSQGLVFLHLSSLADALIEVVSYTVSNEK